MDGFYATLDEEVQDAYEETFDLFSSNSALPDLGMVDPKAGTITLSVSDRDFVIQQSPGSLQSSRKEGTTGAVVWKSSVLAADWLALAKNPLFALGLLDSESTVLELGSGISGLVPCVLAPIVKTVTATDQRYFLKLLRTNMDANAPQRRVMRPNRARGEPLAPSTPAVNTLSLDWEEDDVPRQLSSNGLADGVDVVIACDCIFNYALIDPFVQACVNICQLRQRQVHGSDTSKRSTVCVIVQQLRQSEVFEQWLQTCMHSFHVWRLPSTMLSDGLVEGSGFAVHVCKLR